MTYHKSTKPGFRNRPAALLPHPLSAAGVMWWVTGIFYLKFLLFDLIWATDSTFSGFQFPIGYCTKLCLATLLAMPMLALRSRFYAAVISIALDIWLIANLMYFRTYFTVIPASSYGLIGNLADFQDSVWESLRWADIALPLTTLLLLVELSRTHVGRVLREAWRRLLRNMLIIFAVPAAITAVYVLCKGGYKAAYNQLMYDYSTCGAAVYTIPGAMAYEYINGHVELTPELQQEIQQWLAARPGADWKAPAVDAPENCIVILLESFESWLIGAVVEGREITPRINAMVADTTSFYAPHMQTQVKGARSIDAQLILHTGLLPVNYGAYSYRFVHNTYPSIDKAWAEKYGPEARSMSFTVDKRTVWNVAVVARQFGYELYDKPDFVLDVRTGPRGRLGDHSFLRQSAEKIETDEYWNPRGHNLVQLVTYSGHTPFVIPDELKQVHFSKELPDRLAHYLEVANYTDRAVGDFVDRIRNNPRFANTTIVITGDHEGMGAPRADYLKVKSMQGVMSTQWETPFLVLDGPVAGRYDGVFGQVDMYPTLLDMLGLDAYSWHGLGTSLLDPARPTYAITPLGRIVGDTTSMTAADEKHLRAIYDISDLIITSDYFAR